MKSTEEVLVLREANKKEGLRKITMLLFLSLLMDSSSSSSPPPKLPPDPSMVEIPPDLLAVLSPESLRPPPSPVGKGSSQLVEPGKEILGPPSRRDTTSPSISSPPPVSYSQIVSSRKLQNLRKIGTVDSTDDGTPSVLSPDSVMLQ